MEDEVLFYLHYLSYYSTFVRIDYNLDLIRKLLQLVDSTYDTDDIHASITQRMDTYIHRKRISFYRPGYQYHPPHD